jgi:hypothetical protein
MMAVIEAARIVRAYDPSTGTRRFAAAAARVSSRTCIGRPSSRRVPPPWLVDEQDACFILRDANGWALAYVYFADESGRRAAKLLTKDEARPDGGELRQAAGAAAAKGLRSTARTKPSARERRGRTH